jgi:hypothetical protein
MTAARYGRRQVANALFATDPFPDLAFGRALDRTWSDLVVRAFEVMEARVRRRNPGPPPWRRRAIDGWQRVGPGEGPTERAQPETPLLAAVAAWNEDDIIFVTVRNLFAQGANRVFVIDDGSDDHTGAEARAAGGTVVPRHSNGRYSEAVRAASIAQLVATETAAAGGAAWWLLVDADELPTGPDGMTVRHLVDGLPGWVDVVGSRVLDHVPHRGSSLSPREDPLVAFPLARLYHNSYCPSGHWKHQLIRVRRPGDVRSLPGQHVASSGDGRVLREPATSLLMHHFPLRGLDRTAAKYRAAIAPDGRYTRSPDAFSRARVTQRIHELEKYHAGECHLVLDPFPGRRRRPSDVRPWQEFVPPGERHWPN